MQKEGTSMQDARALTGPEDIQNHHTILIVDDVPENLTVLGTLLREAGYRVKAAKSGRAALRSAGRTPRPVVVQRKFASMLARQLTARCRCKLSSSQRRCFKMPA